MELRHLRYFIAIAEELHFGRAAKRLNMSQPPLSKQLRELELEIGARLFERSTQRVALTQAGRAFLPHAQKLLNEAAHARQVAVRAGRGEIGRVSVGFVASAEFSFFPTILAKFCSDYPEVEVSLATVERLGSPTLADALRDHRIDVAFNRVPSAGDEFVVEGVAEEDLVVALPSHHPLASQSVVALADLQDDCLVPSQLRVEQGFYGTVLRACAEVGFTPRFRTNVVQDTIDIPGALLLVAAGLGFALIPESWTRIRLPELVFRHLSPAPRVALVLERRAELPTPALASFMRMAAGELGAFRAPFSGQR